RGERGEQHEPPQTRRREQKRCNKDRIRRPENRDRMRFERERKANLATKIISSEHPQPSCQQLAAKDRTNTIRVPLCWLNVRFKDYRNTLHRLRISPLPKS